MSATTERKTVSRIDIEHAIDAREDARVAHIRACRRDNWHPGNRDVARAAYVSACTTLRDLLDRWEDQLRGWEEGA
jgi:hypothetical protein